MNGSPDTSRWDDEIDESLKKNIIGGCKVNKDMMPLEGIKQVASPNELLAQVLYPSKLEVRHMKQLPVTLTLADKDLADNAKRWDYTPETWGKGTYRWEVPISHPGQDRNNCISMTFLAATESVVSYYETFKNIKRAFYVIHGKQAFIHPSGAVGFSCGYYMGEEACENRWNYAENWYKPCKQHMEKNNYEWRMLFDSSVPDNTTNSIIQDGCADRGDLGSTNKKDFIVAHHRRVYTIPALWDYNYHHWVADSLARLTRNLRFLRANPDIKIHIREFEEYDSQKNRDNRFKEGAKKMRLKFLDLLGLDRKRIVSGAILAQEVYIPRFLRCSYLLSNPAELQLLSKQLLSAAHIELGLKMERVAMRPLASNNKQQQSQLQPQAQANQRTTGMSGRGNRTVIIQQRFTKFGSNYREWNDQTVGPVVQAFEKYFPEHNIVLLSSKQQINSSLANEIYQYSQADVLVGLHGAGMTNMMFMPANSLIVEFVGQLVDVHMPVCGYYGPMAAAFGHHHYIHSYDVNEKEGMDTRAEQGAMKAFDFYQLLHSHKKDIPILQVYNSLKVKNQ